MTFKALNMNSGHIVFFPSLIHNLFASEDNCFMKPLKIERSAFHQNKKM